MFLSSGDGYLGNFLHQGCQGHFRDARGKVRYLSRSCSGKGPHLVLKGESPGFSQVAAANLGFLSSYDGDLRQTLVWPQESPVSMRVVRGLLGFLSSRFRVLGPHLEPQVSSPVLTWISGFIWSFNRGVKPRLVWRYASPLSSRAVTGVSSFLSS